MIKRSLPRPLFLAGLCIFSQLISAQSQTTTLPAPSATPAEAAIPKQALQHKVPHPPRTSDNAITPRESPRYAARQDACLQQIEAAHGDFNFVLIGDSITDFWPEKGKDSYSEFLPWKPLNLGVSGESTEHVLYRITNGELEKLHPKVVMILIGTNNLRHYDEQPEWAAAGVRKIIEVVRAKCPNAKILLVAILPRDDPKDPYRPKTATPMRPRVVATNKLLAALGDNKTVFFMDLGERFTDAQGNLRLDLFQPDALHPNAAGYQVWLQAVKPKLTELMGVTTP